MLKIFNYAAKSGPAFDTVRNGFLDYIPGDKFTEVSNIDESDIIFMTGSIDSTGLLNFHFSGTPESFQDLNRLSGLYTNIDSKKRIIWLDTMGPNINKDESLLSNEKTGLRDDDIIISPASLPRDNVFTDAFFVEKSIFRPKQRYQRVKGSIMMCYDNLSRTYNSNDAPSMLAPNMDVISKLDVSTRGLLVEKDLETTFEESLSKIKFENFIHPFGIADRLSQTEFVLTTLTGVGVEILGIEGGMCGCQPIYPDTEFYRDIFDNTGVAFYDTENKEASLRSIIQAGSTFDKEVTEVFRTKFSSEDTLPIFWQKVYELYV